jgi:ABC-type transport system involved in multi-copper enzyme maturation permease subunit
MKFDIEPLGFDDPQRLKWLLTEWVQDAGGFAMVGLALWVLNSLIYPVYDILPDGRKRNRLVSPAMLFAGAVALTGYLISLGVLYIVAGEPPGTPIVTMFGRPMTAMQRVLEWALALSGLAALVGFGGPFVMDLMKLRWRRIYALAKLSFKEAVRRKVVWVFLVILIVYLFPARWFFQEKPEDEIKGIVAVTTRGMNILLVLVGLLLAAFSIPSDIKNLTIHTVVTKPVERFEIILGRFLGYLGLLTAALLVMTGFGLVLINAGNISEEAAAESLRSRVARYGDMQFRSQKQSDFTGIDVGKENGYRKYIAGMSSQRVVWNYPSFPSRFTSQSVVPLEFAFDIYRTTKGAEGAGVQVTFDVLTHNWDPRQEDEYAKASQGLVNIPPDDPQWAKVDALAEKYGRYTFKNRQIFDYHTTAIPVPGGLFRNAQNGTPAVPGPIQSPGQPPNRVQVVVKCETPSQFIGAARYDLYFLDGEGSFSFNYFKGAAGLWCRLVIALALAVACSTYLAGVLSFLLALLLFVGGFFKETILEIASGKNVGGGPLEGLARLIKNSNATADLDPTPGIKALQLGDTVFQWGVRRLMNVFPNVDQYGFSDYVAQGFSIGPDFLLMNFLTLVAYVLPWLVAGYYLMKAREVAA